MNIQNMSDVTDTKKVTCVCSLQQQQKNMQKILM